MLPEVAAIKETTIESMVYCGNVTACAAYMFDLRSEKTALSKLVA